MSTILSEDLSDRHPCLCAICTNYISYRYYMLRFFIMGFILPLFWIVNIMLYIYLNFVKSTVPVLYFTEGEILFTEFELQSWRERHIMLVSQMPSSSNVEKPCNLEKSIEKASDLKNSVGQIEPNCKFSSTQNIPQHSTNHINGKIYYGDFGRDQANPSFSANDIIQGVLPEMEGIVLSRHLHKEKCLRNWAWRSFSCIVGYALVVSFTFLAVTALKFKS